MTAPRFVASLTGVRVNGRPVGPSMMRALRARWADSTFDGSSADFQRHIEAHRQRMHAMRHQYRAKTKGWR